MVEQLLANNGMATVQGVDAGECTPLPPKLAAASFAAFENLFCRFVGVFLDFAALFPRLVWVSGVLKKKRK